MFKIIADAESEAFELMRNKEIHQLSEAARIDCTETTFCGKGDVPFSAYKKSMEYSTMLSKKEFW